MLQQLARDFAEDEIKPNAGKWDSNSQFPRACIKKASDSGLLTLKIPEKYGGGGMGSFEEVLVCEEFGAGGPGFATACGSTMLASYPILTGGTEDQKERYMTKVSEGCIASYCVTEPGAGSHVQSLQTEATKDGMITSLMVARCGLLGRDMPTGSSFWLTLTKRRDTVE